MKKNLILLLAFLFLIQGCTNIKTPSAESEPLPAQHVWSELDKTVDRLPDNGTFGTENFQFVTKTYGDDPQDKTGDYSAAPLTYYNPIQYIDDENLLVGLGKLETLFRYNIKTQERIGINVDVSLLKKVTEAEYEFHPHCFLLIGENHYFVYDDKYCLEVKDDKAVDLQFLTDFNGEDVVINYKQLSSEFRYAPFGGTAEKTTVRRGDYNPYTGLLAFVTEDHFIFISDANLKNIRELELYEGYASSVQWLDDSTLYIYGFHYMGYDIAEKYYFTDPFILKYNVKTDDWFYTDDADRQFFNSELEKSVPGYTNLNGYSGRDANGAVIVNADNTVYTIQYGGNEFAEYKNTDWVEILCANEYVGIVFNRRTKSEICLYNLHTGEFYKVLEFDKPDEFTSYRFTSVSPNASSFLLQKSGGGQSELLLVTKK